ncbi:unnamed protein product [Effrenium voratum]|nr:unnamed protein product [Effrenium voratum]
MQSFDFTLLATVQFQAEAPECRILSREGAWLFAASGAGVRFVGPPQPVEDPDD